MTKSKLKNEYARWNAERFNGKKSASIRVDLYRTKLSCFDNGFLCYQSINESVIRTLTRRFRVELNQLCFGNAAKKYGKQLTIVTTVHEMPQLHLHIQAEIPDRESFVRIKSFVDGFALKNSWIKNFPYVSETRSDIGSQIYNSRFGSETIIDF